MSNGSGEGVPALCLLFQVYINHCFKTVFWFSLLVLTVFAPRGHIYTLKLSEYSLGICFILFYLQMLNCMATWMVVNYV